MNSYGFHPDCPSAQLTAANIKGELYFACAQHDDYISAEILDEVARIIAKSGIYARIECFALATRRVYHKKSAERHWERLFHLFRRNLH